jgi:endonuclease-3
MDYEKKIRAIDQRLKDYYGEPERPSDLSGMEYLVETILSQNTNDINRDKAFRNFQEKYDSWAEVENADREELIDTIRIAGLGPTKAERIQESLRIVREDQNEYSLEFINDISIKDGKKWLTDIPGIGPKTAAIILCFHFGKPVMPVDTHVHRVSQRLGLVSEGISRSKAHEVLEERVPDDIKYEFHRLLIDHGRKHCKAQNATCCEGPLADLCSNCEEIDSMNDLRI